SCAILENDLNQLVNILNTVDISKVYIVSQYISSINYTIDTVKRNFERMLQLNEVELHILFDEFNNKTNDIIFKLNMLSNDLEKLSLIATKLYSLYKLAESMDFFLEHSLSTDSLKKFIPNIIK